MLGACAELRIATERCVVFLKKFSDKSRIPRSYGSDGRVLVVPAVNRQYLCLETGNIPSHKEKMHKSF